MPDKFLRKQMAAKGIELPPEGEYGSGLVFLSPQASEREAAMQVFEHVIREEGQRFIGWRTVPVKSEILGNTSGRYEPVIKQVFIGKNPSITCQNEFERRLYIIRKRVASWIRNNEMPGKFRNVHGTSANKFPGADYHYVTGLSSRTMIYKGMLTPCQLATYFPDFHDPDFESALALFDQHVPELVARAPEPLHRPQRRDQHGDGQRQHDEGTRGPVPERAVRRRDLQGHAGHQRGWLGLRPF